MRTVLYPEWLVDGTGSPPLANHVVAFAGGLIEVVASAGAFSPREDDRVVRLDGMTLIPGLINNHAHLTLPGDNTPWVPWIETQSDAALALRAAHNSATALRSGVTTVRDCGSRATTVLDLRSAQAQGLLPGARIISGGNPLTITGGHMRPFGGECDGDEGVRRMVRRQVSNGADFVKVAGSGGGTPGSFSQLPSFSVAELRAVVETAHTLGRLVSVHCTATAAIANAVAAGADLIEHCQFNDPDFVTRFDPAVAEKLAKAAIPVTLTLQVSRDIVDLADSPDRVHWTRRREAALENVAKLHQLGVPILAGSDAGWRATRFDTFWKELDELVRTGLSPVQAVHAATGAVARALRRADQLGAIRPGLIADLVAVEGNLAADVRCLQAVRAVFQAGTVVHSSSSLDLCSSIPYPAPAHQINSGGTT